MCSLHARLADGGCSNSSFYLLPLIIVHQEVLKSSLGPSWATNFASFERIPFAAASIGQVHHAVLAASASPTGREERVAVKVQFPNIADSIASDLGYVKMLLTAGRLLPRGLFLDRTIQVRAFGIVLLMVSHVVCRS